MSTPRRQARSPQDDQAGAEGEQGHEQRHARHAAKGRGVGQGDHETGHAKAHVQERQRGGEPLGAEPPKHQGVDADLAESAADLEQREQARDAGQLSTLAGSDPDRTTPSGASSAHGRMMHERPDRRTHHSPSPPDSTGMPGWGKLRANDRRTLEEDRTWRR